MDKTTLFIFLAVVLNGISGLAGGLVPSSFIKKNQATLLAFAAGTLIGTAFLHLLPESLSKGISISNVMIATAAGFIGFYIIESFLGSHAAGQSGHKHSKIGPLILIGDAIHNITDGVAIAAAFFVDFKTGLATTLTVIVHELPQEIGDFSILVSHGYSRKSALFYLAIVQLSALLGAFGAIIIEPWMIQVGPYLLAISAGGFVYIAAADLLPELHRNRKSNTALAKFISFSIGLVLVKAIEQLL